MFSSMYYTTFISSNSYKFCPLLAKSLASKQMELLITRAAQIFLEDRRFETPAAVRRVFQKFPIIQKHF